MSQVPPAITSLCPFYKGKQKPCQKFRQEFTGGHEFPSKRTPSFTWADVGWAEFGLFLFFLYSYLPPRQLKHLVKILTSVILQVFSLRR